MSNSNVVTKEGVLQDYSHPTDDGSQSDSNDEDIEVDPNETDNQNGEEQVPIQSNLKHTDKGNDQSFEQKDEEEHVQEDEQNGQTKKDEDDDVNQENGENPANLANNANQNDTSSALSRYTYQILVVAIIGVVLWTVFGGKVVDRNQSETPICSRIPDESVKYKLQCPKCDAYDITGKCIIYAPLSSLQITIDAQGEDGSFNDHPCTHFAWDLHSPHLLTSGDNSPSLSVSFGDDAERVEIELAISIEIRDEKTRQLKWYQGKECKLDLLIYEAPYFGIDLGTSYSCIAYQAPGINPISSKRDTNIVIMDMNKREHCIPSSVYFDFHGEEQPQIYIGHAAKERAIANDNDFDNYVYDIKRIIGRTVDDPSLKTFHAAHTFELDLNSGDYPSIKIANGNSSNDVMRVTPDQIQAILLRELVRVASNEFGVPDLQDVVVSIPAMFHDAQRKAVHTACSIAGLNAKLLMVEPSAASIAYIYDPKQDSEKLREFSKYFMTLDIGGGTTDVSILRCTGLHCEVLGVAGNSSLGGIDFDGVIVDIMRHKMETQKIAINEQLEDEMRSQAEKVKKALSTNDEYNKIRLQNERENDYVQLSVTKKEFEEHAQTQALMQSIIALAKQAMFDETNSNKKGLEHLTNVRAILLIGGTVKIPYIRQRLQAEFGGEEKRTQLIYPDDDPQLMVVKGSAIIGGTMAYTDSSNADILHNQILGATATDIHVSVDDVLPMSFGFDVCVIDYEQEDGHKCGVMDILIHKNSKYPTKGSGVYCQKVASAATATLMLYEGDHHMVDKNFFLTKLEINDVPPRSDYECNNIVVELSIDENGIANITARTNEQVYSKELPVKSNDAHLSDEEIKELHQQIVTWQGPAV